MSSQVMMLENLGILRHGVPLGPLTTYKSGGPARLMAEVADRGQMDLLITSGLTTSNRVLVLGRGSNLVVADTGFDGLVVRLGEAFAGVAAEGTTVVAGAAMPLPRLARSIVDQGLTGLEFFVGVPGSVGGAVRQNAGCFGVETIDRLATAEIVDLLDGRMLQLSPADLGLSYRHSNLAPHQVVVGASFDVERGDTRAAREEMRAITRWRRDNQPGGTLNAGSVFKNPPDVTAGELIDRVGLKGLTAGDVSVSAKHANFFTAGPGASSADIRRLVELVKDRVLELSGTMLETEIQFVGFDE